MIGFSLGLTAVRAGGGANLPALEDQTVKFGAIGTSATGGFRLRRTDGSYEDAASVATVGGSPSYNGTPQVASGRVVFDGGRPADGALLDVTGSTGRTCRVTIERVENAVSRAPNDGASLFSSVIRTHFQNNSFSISELTVLARPGVYSEGFLQADHNAAISTGGRTAVIEPHDTTEAPVIIADYIPPNNNVRGQITYRNLQFYRSAANSAATFAGGNGMMDEQWNAVFEDCFAYGDRPSDAQLALEEDLRTTGTGTGGLSLPSAFQIADGGVLRRCRADWTWIPFNVRVRTAGAGFIVEDCTATGFYYDGINIVATGIFETAEQATAPRIIQNNTLELSLSRYEEINSHLGGSDPHTDGIQLQGGTLNNIVFRRNVICTGNTRNLSKPGGTQTFINSMTLRRPEIYENVFSCFGSHGISLQTVFGSRTYRNTVLQQTGTASGWIRTFEAASEGRNEIRDNYISGVVADDNAGPAADYDLIASGNDEANDQWAGLTGPVNPANAAALLAAATPTGSIAAGVGALTAAGAFREGATVPARIATTTRTPVTGGFQVTATAPDAGGGTISHYIVRYRATGSTGAWVTVDPYTLGNTISAAADDYDVTLAAVNEAGAGFLSPIETVTVASASPPSFTIVNTGGFTADRDTGMSLADTADGTETYGVITLVLGSSGWAGTALTSAIFSDVGATNYGAVTQDDVDISTPGGAAQIGFVGHGTPTSGADRVDYVFTVGNSNTHWTRLFARLDSAVSAWSGNIAQSPSIEITSIPNNSVAFVLAGRLNGTSATLGAVGATSGTVTSQTGYNGGSNLPVTTAATVEIATGGTITFSATNANIIAVLIAST